MMNNKSMLPVGTVLRNTYRIEKQLASGGFGNTYVATNIEFEETVAIKEFFMKGVTERDETTSTVSVSNAENVQQFEEQREKFKKEARRLRRLKNEHIVRVHDLFEENGTAYYVMDYVDGESLAERLKRTGQPLEEAEVRQILEQVLQALQEVHGQQIWHLDLKPGNIMLDRRGTAYLIDFGASKQIRPNGSMTTSTALCYTPGYAPTEQVGQMFDRFGPWTDFYALGATLYSLLTKIKPPMSIDLDEDGEEAFAFPATLSNEMRQLIVWLMQPRRKARPQSVSEIVARLGARPQSADESTRHGVSVENYEETIIVSATNVSQPSARAELISPKQYAPLKNSLANAVDLGLSVKWADCNVGGTPYNPKGGLYGWADPTGEKRSQIAADYVPLAKYLSNQIPDDIAGTEYDIAAVRWGGNWRMPNKEQWKELIEKCQWQKCEFNHVWGYQVTGPNGNSIFLPFTGIRTGDYIYGNASGYYWTSEKAIGDRKCAHYYYFDSEMHNDTIGTINYVYTGRAVRPVCD